jgi:alkylation response protein AidB-like acyl-CoA dehydrogenase
LGAIGGDRLLGALGFAKIHRSSASRAYRRSSGGWRTAPGGSQRGNSRAQLGRLKDQGAMHHSHVSMAKWNNVRMGLDVARDARDILGAGGISIECCPIRHMLNLESVITYEGTETIHELVVGRELTGHAAF